MTKILYLITKGNWGGAQRYVYDLATHLPQGYEAVVSAYETGVLAEKLRAKNIRYIELKNAWQIVEVIKKERPNILHLNSSKMAGIGAFLGWCIKTFNIYHLTFNIIFTAHGWPFNEDRAWWQKLLIYKLSWLTSLFSDITITLTNRDFAQGKRMWFVGHKVRLIRNAIEQIDFISPPTPSYLKRGREDEILIGTIAELTKNKGLEYLIQAMKDVEANLVIIGEGPLRSSLENLTQRLDLGARVKLLGFVPNASSLLKAFDIFVLPSLKEGLPYVLLEATQAGLPIVATNVGGIPDILGDKGILVPPKNTQALTEALRKTITSLPVQTNYPTFSFTDFLKQTYALYK